MQHQSELRYRLHQLLSMFPEQLMQLTEREQHLSLKIYELLSHGAPVALSTLAEAARLREDDVRQILDQWFGVFKNDREEIVGYWGLALEKMHHRMHVNGTTLYTWCAWDSLFIPALLNTAAEVVSPCAVTGETVTLQVTPEGVTYKPDTAVMSYVKPEDCCTIDENVVANFCHKIYFFKSADVAGEWLEAHPETFLMSIEDAFRLGQEKNKLRYAAVL